MEAVAPIVIHEGSNNKKDSEKVGEEAREVVVEESGGNPIRFEDVVQKEQWKSSASEEKASKEGGDNAGSASQ